MSDTTDTPITDAARQKFRGDTDGLCRELIKTSNDLERQLAEANQQHDAVLFGAKLIDRDLKLAIEQRDRLAEAIKAIKRFAATKATHAWIEQIAREALATLDRKEGA